MVRSAVKRDSKIPVLATLDFFDLKPGLVAFVEGCEFFEGDVDQMIQASDLGVSPEEGVKIIDYNFF